MKTRFCMLTTALVAAIWMVPRSVAEPAWGGNCLSCHGQLLEDVIFVFGEDTLADPDESGTGAPDHGTLKVFQAFRGGWENLRAQVSDLEEGDTYAVALRRLRFPGVENGGRLYYAADCDWPEWGSPPAYYTEPYIAYRWGSDPHTFAYEIGVGHQSGYDYYDLLFAVAGKVNATGELFYAQEHFYLQVWFGPGDANCDGTVDGFDIQPFVLALTNPAQYESDYPSCSLEQADCNYSGGVDGFDIQPFVELLTGG